MGCLYSISQAEKSSFYTSMSTNSPSFAVSFPNEEYFLVPKNFSFETNQLKDIITGDQLHWRNYKNTLIHMSRDFQDKAQSISWFLNTQAHSRQSVEDSAKFDSASSIHFLNSTNQITYSSSGNSVCLKKNFCEHFPYMKTFCAENFRAKIIFELDSVICSRNFLARNPSLDQPFVEIEIFSFEDFTKKDDGEIKIGDICPEITKKRTLTLPISQGRSFEWKEIISSEILNQSEFDQGYFKISLYFMNRRSKKKELVGENYIFSFSELGNQVVFEKILNIKDFEQTEISCYLLFKCQLIFDVEGLLFFWKNDIEVKIEVIKRILSRTEIRNYEQNSMKKSKSLIFQDKKVKEDLKMMMESFQNAFTRTLNMSLRNERVSFKEAYKRTFAHKLMDSMISQESGISQSGYYDNKYYLA